MEKKKKKSELLLSQEKYHAMRTEGGCQSVLNIAQKIIYFFL